MIRYFPSGVDVDSFRQARAVDLERRRPECSGESRPGQRVAGRLDRQGQGRGAKPSTESDSGLEETRTRTDEDKEDSGSRVGSRHPGKSKAEKGRRGGRSKNSRDATHHGDDGASRVRKRREDRAGRRAEAGKGERELELFTDDCDTFGLKTPGEYEASRAQRRTYIHKFQAAKARQCEFTKEYQAARDKHQHYLQVYEEATCKRKQNAESVEAKYQMDFLYFQAARAKHMADEQEFQAALAKYNADIQLYQANKAKSQVQRHCEADAASPTTKNERLLHGNTIVRGEDYYQKEEFVIRKHQEQDQSDGTEKANGDGDCSENPDDRNAGSNPSINGDSAPEASADALLAFRRIFLGVRDEIEADRMVPKPAQYKVDIDGNALPVLTHGDHLTGNIGVALKSTVSEKRSQEREGFFESKNGKHLSDYSSKASNESRSDSDDEDMETPIKTGTYTHTEPTNSEPLETSLAKTPTNKDTNGARLSKTPTKSKTQLSRTPTKGKRRTWDTSSKGTKSDVDNENKDTDDDTPTEKWDKDTIIIDTEGSRRFLTEKISRLVDSKYRQQYPKDSRQKKARPGTYRSPQKKIKDRYSSSTGVSEVGSNVDDDVVKVRAAAAAQCPCTFYFKVDLSPKKVNLACDTQREYVTYEYVQTLVWSKVTREEKLRLVARSGFPLLSCLADDYYCPVLHLVIMLCHRQDILQMTVGRGRDLPQRDSAKNTAFMMMVASPSLLDTDIRKCLDDMDYESATALVRGQNAEGLTPLHMAVLRCRPDVASVLLSYGADANAGSMNLGKDRKGGLTPFHLSLMRPCNSAFRCFSTLLKSHADINVEVLAPRADDRVTKRGSFRFECDCGGCWSNVVRGFDAVLPEAVLRTTDADLLSKGTALNVALALGEVRKAEAMLKARSHINVNLDDDKGLTPLSYAVLAAELDTVDLLLRKGADVNHLGSDEYGRLVDTPLVLAFMLVARGDKRVPRRFPGAGSAREFIYESTECLQRLRAVNDELDICPWCDRRNRKPVTADNVSEKEKDILRRLEEENESSVGKGKRPFRQPYFHSKTTYGPLG